MERKRNWLGWAALALGALALVVALGGRFGPGNRMSMMNDMRAVPAAPAAPQAPDMPYGRMFERGEPGERGPMAFRGERDESRFMQGRHGESMMGGMMMERHRPGMGLFGFFWLLKSLGQLVALGLLAWLLLKLFNQRRNGPPTATAGGPDVPRTPAGHDPRVE